MAKRTKDVTSVAGKGVNHNGWLNVYAANRETNPYDAAWMAEEAKIILEERSDTFVRVFLTGCRAWSATEIAARPCPVCKGLPLAPGWYCGACDRPKGSLARTVKPKPRLMKMPGVKAVDVMTRREKRAKAKKGRAA